VSVAHKSFLTGKKTGFKKQTKMYHRGLHPKRTRVANLKKTTPNKKKKENVIMGM